MTTLAIGAAPVPAIPGPVIDMADRAIPLGRPVPEIPRIRRVAIIALGDLCVDTVRRLTFCGDAIMAA